MYVSTCVLVYVCLRVREIYGVVNGLIEYGNGVKQLNLKCVRDNRDNDKILIVLTYSVHLH